MNFSFDLVIKFNPTITKEYGLSPCGKCKTMSLNMYFKAQIYVCMNMARGVDIKQRERSIAYEFTPHSFNIKVDPL